MRVGAGGDATLGDVSPTCPPSAENGTNCQVRTVVVALFCFGVSSLAVAEEPAACPPDMQRFEAVCLSNRMIAYLKCLEKINGGRLHIAKDETDTKPSSVTVEIEGEGHAAIAKGSGKVKIDSRNDQTSIRKLDETISPDVVTGCIELAGVARAPAAKRKRSTARKGADQPDKKPPADPQAKPVIPPGKYVPPNQSRLEKECGGGALEACALLAGIISDDKRIADLAGRACAGGVALGCTTLADFNSEHYPREENGGQYPQVVKAWMADKVLPYYKRACAADEPGGCAGYAVKAARYELASGTEDLDGLRAKATALWEKSCAKGHLDDCDMLADWIAFKEGSRACAIFTALCEAARTKSCRRAGSCYETSQPGEIADLERAETLYRKGCLGGDGAACGWLNALLANRQKVRASNPP